ncbi:MAG: UDP-glucose 4-epimerase GalE [Bacteroidales bacterium]|jgi:UDP-glucose 4-epimerase|nr:UDP-glucose 4-epimerase GalE [Bacteroidales bacterium]HHV39775.1 UDP-glucose 4-epimerase GalE [Bacteroidales bacterium]
MKTILITGGAGYIGSHTAVELVAAGYQVVVVDNLSNADTTCLKGAEKITGRSLPFYEIDCCCKEDLQTVFKKHPIDGVIHFAAFKAVGESVEKPLMYYKNNLTSFLTVLEVLLENGGGNIVFSSSATVYGQPDILPATEDTPRGVATNPYGNTKQICEDILTDAVKAHPTLQGIILRYFNPIGAHPSALMGELPRGVPNNLVPFITQTAAGVRDVLQIFGSDYNTPDGTALRDYIDVNDLARAHVSALQKMYTKNDPGSCEIYNVGTGQPLSVLELVQKFCAVNNIKVKYKMAGRRQGDVEAVWANTSLANKHLQWKAEVPVEETLARAWAWEKKIRDL